MPHPEFLEKYPLYRKFEIDVPYLLREIPKPSIHMFCKKCDSDQTFIMTNNYQDTKDYSAKSLGEIVLMEYTCAGCSMFKRHFLIKISEQHDYVMKVGQYLPWDISIDKNIEKLLGEHAELFKKGLICESQGYGIGAYTYYRRIVELIIDELLDSIQNLVPENEKEKYLKALGATKKTKIATEKIELVKDLLPSILRPNNMNPLSTLHDVLSQGIHEKSDDDCMQTATNIKNVLVFLVNQVISSRESAKEFTESMKTLLAKKS